MAHDLSLDYLTGARFRLRNTLHTLLLANASLLILAATAWAFAGWVGVAYALFFGGLSLWAMGQVSPQIVLRMYDARPVLPAAFPEGSAMLEELARRAGLPAVPRLYVVPSRLFNAFAVGRPDDAAIAVTNGLLRALSLRELAGVLAHEVSHIAHDDLKVMALADMVSRFTSFMSTVGIALLFFNLFGFFGSDVALVPWLAVLILLAAPTVSGLLQLALSRTREFDADLGAAMLTGDPDGLASALRKLERIQGRNWESLVLPGGRTPDPSILRTHPPTTERITRLMALKRGEQLPPSVEKFVRARMASQEPRLHPVILPGPWGPLVMDTIDRPAARRGLSDIRDRPRIRIWRGGVWW
jgi:heat shock protein HtpX